MVNRVTLYLILRFWKKQTPRKSNKWGWQRLPYHAAHQYLPMQPVFAIVYQPVAPIRVLKLCAPVIPSPSLQEQSSQEITLVFVTPFQQVPYVRVTKYVPAIKFVPVIIKPKLIIPHIGIRIK